MESTAKLPVIRPAFITTADYRMIALSIAILFLFSTFRLLVFLVTGYLVVYLSQPMMFVLALFPGVALLSPKSLTKHWFFFALALPVFWFLQIITPLPFLNIILYELATFSLLIVFKQGFQYELEMENRYILTESIFIGILLDILIRSINSGREPVIYADTIPKLIYFLVAVLFVLLLIPSQTRVNDKPLESSENKATSTRKVWSRNLGILALFQGFLVFSLYYANPGVFSRYYSDNIDLNLVLFTVVTFAEVLIVLIFRKEVFRWMKFLIPSSLMVFLLSILFYPWEDLFLLLWVIGTLSLLILLAGNITQADLLDENNSRSLGLMIFVGILTDIALLAIIIQYEYTILNTIVPVLFCTLSLISFLLYPWGWKI